MDKNPICGIVLRFSAGLQGFLDWFTEIRLICGNPKNVDKYFYFLQAKKIRILSDQSVKIEGLKKLQMHFMGSSSQS